MPSYEQLFSVARICQTLSNFYYPINLFRYDTTKDLFFILAGSQATLEIYIYADGTVYFDDEE